MKPIKIITASDLSALKELISNETAFLVVDSHVTDYLSRMGLESVPSYTLKATEANKKMETVLDICRWLIDHDADRNALVVAIGGGVTSDVAGFAASIYKRGIRYVNVPTTLLSQVDAGLGGKTGVNLDNLKNMLGTIRQPEYTWICPAFLETLPKKEYVSGCAEILKTFLIGSQISYLEAVAVISNGKQLGKLIGKAAKIKARIVNDDPMEKDHRRILNLGHTYGHAIEWYQSNHEVKKKLTHGEAVAIGIIKAAELSEAKGIAGEGFCAQLKRDFKACGLPTEFPMDEKELEQALKQDKKSSGGKIHHILLKDIGKAIIE